MLHSRITDYDDLCGEDKQKFGELVRDLRKQGDNIRSSFITVKNNLSVPGACNEL